MTIADPESDAFADETAVTVTVAGFGMVLGAVYNPFDVIVPAAVLLPGVPFTCQVTAVFMVPVTVAMNCWLAPGLTVAVAGLTETVIGGGCDVLPPQAPRNAEARSPKIKTTRERMRSPVRASDRPR